MASAQGAEKPAPRSRRPANKPKQEKTKASKSSSVINLRVDDATRTLIDSAVRVLGQNRTEFMLMSARVRAQEVLLNQTRVVLSDEDWEAFQADLEAPAIPTPELVALMASTPPWAK